MKLAWEEEEMMQKILNSSKVDLILLWCMTKQEVLDSIIETELLISMQSSFFGGYERYANLLKYNLKLLTKTYYSKQN